MRQSHQESPDLHCCDVRDNTTYGWQRARWCGLVGRGARRRLEVWRARAVAISSLTNFVNSVSLEKKEKHAKNIRHPLWFGKRRRARPQSWAGSASWRSRPDLNLPLRLGPSRPCSRRDLPKFDGSAFLKIELLNWYPGSWWKHCSKFPRCSRSLRWTWCQAFSSRVISLNTLLALAPLSCIIARSFSGAVGVRDDLHSSRFCLYSGELIIFIVLHHQDPSLQCFPLSHNRNAFVTGCRMPLHQLFQIRFW